MPVSGPRLTPPERTELFDALFAEAEEIRDPAKTIAGPFAKDFDAIDQHAIDTFNDNCGVGNNDERLKPDALQSELAYRTSTTTRQLADLVNKGIDVEGNRAAANKLRRGQIADLVGDIIAPKLKDQILAPGLLSEPAYSPQRLQRACSLATFRMVFGHMTSILPKEEELRKFATNEGLINESLFRNTYTTTAFQKRFAKEVAIIDVKGASLATIGAIAAKAKSKGSRPFDDVYTILSLRRPGTPEANAIWHSAVLLSADKEHVIIHDPKEIPNEYTSGNRRMVPKSEFADLWSLSSNRAQLILARDIQ